MVGNRVFGHVLILCMACALLMTPWGSLPQDDPTIDSAVQNGVLAESLRFSRETTVSQSALVSGWNGNVAIGRLMIPYWAVIACLAMGSFISCLNWLRFTQLSSVVTFALFGLAASCSLVAMSHMAIAGEVGTGSVLAITCALAGLAMSPSDAPVDQPVIHKIEAVEKRKAA